MGLEQLLHLCGPYMGVFLILLACGLGLPLPEDVPLLTSGYMVHKGLARLELMIPIAMLGVLGGDCTLFFLGRKFGHRVVELRLFKRVVNPPRLLKAEELFRKHGIKIIFVGRFLPGLRSMIFMAAGVLRVPFSAFIAVNGLAACVSVPTLVTLGKFFGHNMDKLRSDVRTVTHVIVLVVVLAGLAVFGWYFHRRQKGLLAETAGKGEAPPEPLPGKPPPDGLG